MEHIRRASVAAAPLLLPNTMRNVGRVISQLFRNALGHKRRDLLLAIWMSLEMGGKNRHQSLIRCDADKRPGALHKQRGDQFPPLPAFLLSPGDFPE
jgi:hypothetical protein